MQIVLQLKPVLQIVQFAQMTQIDNGRIIQRVNLKDISSFCRLYSNENCSCKLCNLLNLHKLLTVLQHVDLKRHLFILPIVPKLKKGLANCAISTNYTN